MHSYACHTRPPTSCRTTDSDWPHRCCCHLPNNFSQRRIVPALAQCDKLATEALRDSIELIGAIQTNLSIYLCTSQWAGRCPRNCSFPGDPVSPPNTMVPWAHPSSWIIGYPKRLPSWFRRFSTAHGCDQQTRTDKQTTKHR